MDGRRKPLEGKMSSPSTMTSGREREDALIYLPRKGVIECRRGQVIYDEQHPSQGLCLVVRGRVKVSITMEDGSQTVTGVYCADEFFGEGSLLGHPDRQERAVALENTTLMSWSNEEIDEQIERQPKLGMALIQILVERCLDFEARLQSMALEKTPQRVAFCLLTFAQRLGVPGPDGAARIPPFTHQLLSEYVGTSREIVTFQMNHLRQLALLRYSRKGIEIFVDALAAYLRNLGTLGK
jgi:CRP-like cAMP-binding protein